MVRHFYKHILTELFSKEKHVLYPVGLQESSLIYDCHIWRDAYQILVVSIVEESVGVKLRVWQI